VGGWLGAYLRVDELKIVQRPSKGRLGLTVKPGTLNGFNKEPKSNPQFYPNPGGQ
jgi:hypothetical protein